MISFISIHSTKQKLLSILELFDNFMQQDAHEFFNFLLNAISEVLTVEKNRERTNGTIKNSNAFKTSYAPNQADLTSTR
jgi:ubiquitin carboxyl-terminal hydrolase 12/46